VACINLANLWDPGHSGFTAARGPRWNYRIDSN